MSTMLIIYISLLISALSAAFGAENVSPSENSPLTSKSKRGVIDQGHNFGEEHQFHQANGFIPTTSSVLQPQNDNSKFLSQYNSVKSASQRLPQIPPFNTQNPSYKTIPSHSSPYIPLTGPVRQSENHQLNQYSSPHFENLFTIPDGYRVVSDGNKSQKQISSSVEQPIGPKVQEISSYSPSHGSFHQNKPIGIQTDGPSSYVQVPAYKSNYAASKPSDYSQSYTPGFHATSSSVPSFETSEKASRNIAYGQPAGAGVSGKKVSLPVFQVQGSQDHPGYLRTIENQPLVLNTGHAHQTTPNTEFNLGSGATKQSAILQTTLPFSSPLSNFQGQIVPIQKASSTPQFPQYKGASIEVYPTIGGLSKAPAGYESLQTQPHLHFGGGSADHGVKGGNPQTPVRQFGSAEEIRTDVEIIKKPTTPLPKDEGSSDEVDEGYKSVEKEYGPGSQEEDTYEHHSGTYFKRPEAESDFKPSKSYPFKQYDEVFGRISKQKSEEITEEKPLSKYHNYSPYSESDSDDSPASKYRSEYTSSKSPYSRYEDDEEEVEKESRKHETYQYNFTPKSYKFKSQ